jgi:hypothetical protein
VVHAEGQGGAAPTAADAAVRAFRS